MTPREFCDNFNPCEEGEAFLLQHPSLAEAWDKCPRADWMLWTLNNIDYKDDKAYRLIACWCVRNTPLGDGRTTWDLLTAPRSRKAVEVAERFAVGEATGEELRAAYAARAHAYAYAAADAAAYDAYANAAYAARARAHAYAYAAADAAAYDAYANAAYAYAAADAAAYAARAAANAAYAYAARAAGVYAAARQAQADQMRRMVANPFKVNTP